MLKRPVPNSNIASGLFVPMTGAAVMRTMLRSETAPATQLSCASIRHSKPSMAPALSSARMSSMLLYGGTLYTTEDEAVMLSVVVSMGKYPKLRQKDSKAGSGYSDKRNARSPGLGSISDPNCVNRPEMSPPANTARSVDVPELYGTGTGVLLGKRNCNSQPGAAHETVMRPSGPSAFSSRLTGM